jgi:uncharacterized protein (DUF427 family)
MHGLILWPCWPTTALDRCASSGCQRVRYRSDAGCWSRSKNAYHGDAWYEEDEEVISHPHDPYHRVDVLQSSRHIKVRVDGEVLAETNRPKMLFETGLPPRFYIPPQDVRTELLVPSETQTVCPNKRVAFYQSMRKNDEVVEDLVWYYPEPLPEAQKVLDLLGFYDKKVELQVDEQK